MGVLLMGIISRPETAIGGGGGGRYPAHGPVPQERSGRPPEAMLLVKMLTTGEEEAHARQ